MINEQNKQLLGAWVTDPDDQSSTKTFGRVRMVFEPNGKLTYIVIGNGTDQVMLLSYRVDGDELVTNQESAPREDRSHFVFMPDGKLMLLYDGVPSVYVRERESLR